MHNISKLKIFILIGYLIFFDLNASTEFSATSEPNQDELLLDKLDDVEANNLVDKNKRKSSKFNNAKIIGAAAAVGAGIALAACGYVFRNKGENLASKKPNLNNNVDLTHYYYCLENYYEFVLNLRICDGIIRVYKIKAYATQADMSSAQDPQHIGYFFVLSKKQQNIEDMVFWMGMLLDGDLLDAANAEKNNGLDWVFSSPLTFKDYRPVEMLKFGDLYGIAVKQDAQNKIRCFCSGNCSIFVCYHWAKGQQRENYNIDINQTRELKANSEDFITVNLCKFLNAIRDGLIKKVFGFDEKNEVHQHAKDALTKLIWYMHGINGPVEKFE